MIQEEELKPIQEEEFLFKVNSEILKGFLKPLKELIKDFRISILEDKILITEIDKPNISLIEVNINKNQFIEYNYNKPLIVGLNVDNLYKIIKPLKKDDISFYIQDNNLILKYNSFKSYIPLIDLNDFNDLKSIDSLNLNYPLKLKLDSKGFKEIIKQFYSLNKLDSIKISFNDNQLNFKSKSNKTEISLNIGDYNILKEEENNIYSFYAIEYLIKLIKIDLSDSVILNLNKEYPLMLEYGLKDFKIKMILSPRIEIED